MRNEQFDEIIDETLDKARAMLTRKSSGYSTEEDRLHNFRTGAALNGVTMEQVCWGMATKHIVSIRDMVMSEEKHPEEVWDEKIGDAINYLAILKAITLRDRAYNNQALLDLREKLTGHRHPSETSAQITVNNDGDILTRNQNVYSQGIETPLTPQQRDIAAVKRVADKNIK